MKERDTTTAKKKRQNARGAWHVFHHTLPLHHGQHRQHPWGRRTEQGAMSGARPPLGAQHLQPRPAHARTRLRARSPRARARGARAGTAQAQNRGCAPAAAAVAMPASFVGRGWRERFGSSLGFWLAARLCAGARASACPSVRASRTTKKIAEEDDDEDGS